MDRLHLDGFTRRLRRRNDRLGGEVERHAENVGIFDIEQSLVRAVLIQLVRLPAQRAADDLLAEQLRSEGADAEDVRYGVRSQPSVSIETEETQRIFPPNCPYLPTVFMTSRSNS